AEDGIRDLTVTGVQTCALPISPRRELVLGLRAVAKLLERLSSPAEVDLVRDLRDAEQHRHACGEAGDRTLARARRGVDALRGLQIGRASCRERVEGQGGGGGVM